MTQTTVPAALPAAPEIVWRATPTGREAHAFRQSGPGWLRSLCKVTALNFRMQRVADDFPRCAGCAATLAPLEGETESEARAAWGDR